MHEVIDVSGSLELDARSKDALLVVTEITQANDEFFSSTIIFVNVRWNQLAWYAFAKLIGLCPHGFKSHRLLFVQQKVSTRNICYDSIVFFVVEAKPLCFRKNWPPKTPGFFEAGFRLLID